MKAIRIHEHGGAHKLRYEEVPQPRLSSPNDVIVNLKAAAVNRTDLSVWRGLRQNGISSPRVLGADGAGVVVEAGQQVVNIHAGDNVCIYPAIGCGTCDFCLTDQESMCADSRVLGQQEDGTYAEYVRVPARNCFKMPSFLSYEEAAAIAVSYVSAWRMLFTNGALKPGESVMIRGTDGISVACLQLAAQFGARSFMTARQDDDLKKAKTYGAEHAINEKLSDFAKEARELTGKRGVDIVVDCVGGDGWKKSLAALAKGGRLVTCGSTAGAKPQSDIRRIFWNHLSIFGSTLGDRREFRQVLAFIESSKLKPVIDRVFSLRDAAAAQRYMEEGNEFGKIVLRIAE